MNQLMNLPNETGFTFIGCFKDGSEQLCKVALNPVGCHSVYKVSDNSPCWFQLVGWKRKE